MPKTIQANLFHEGSTCPYCQESITSGQRIIICPDCSSVQHDLCWGHNDGCASYHCDNKVTTSQPGNFRPEITITDHDLTNIKVPPKPKKQSSEEVAKSFMPDVKQKHSILAIFALVIATISLFGIVGIFSQQIFFFIFALIVAIIATLLGVISLVRINSNRKISGGITAVVSILFSSLMIIGYFLLLHLASNQKIMEQRIDLKMSNMPSEEQLKTLAPDKADALRANAVIKCSESGFFSNLTFGSGVITKIKNKKAFILTNKHVIGITGDKIKPNSKISVALYNGESSTASVAWLAPGTIDIAIIACEVLTLDDLITIKVKPTILAPSQQVFAIGNPMNFFWSYTEGVISSIRTKQIASHAIKVYQTQTPINQGNSGGGLYTMHGSLIGINTWTLNKSLAEGLNFSISSKSIVELLGDRAQEFLSLEEVKK